MSDVGGAAPAAVVDEKPAVVAEPAAPEAAATPAAPEAAPAQAAAPEGTALDGAGADAVVEPTWREDWRERFAGKDEKLLSRLKRFASPENVFKSYLELERKMQSGAVKATLPENATPEEVAAYRKASGIPETPEGYEIKVPDTLVLSETDKADLEAFKSEFHAMNIPPAQAAALANAFFARRLQGEMDLRREAQETTINNRAAIKAEYGRDAERNLTLARNYLDNVVGAETRDALSSITLVDGTRLGDHPAFVKTLVQVALAGAGDDGLAQAEFGGGGKSVQEQYREALERKFSDPVGYASPEHQERLMRLAVAKARLDGRAA